MLASATVRNVLIAFVLTAAALATLHGLFG
jgi:hypothetical protein